MQIAVSTACLYPLESEKSLKKLCEMGFKDFEFFVNSFSELEMPFLREFKNILDFYGAKISSLHPFTCLIESLFFFSDYQRRYDDSLEFYKGYFDAMNYLGADKFILHGQRNFGGGFLLTDKEYCERYLGLYRTAKEFDITVCQENVNGYRSSKIELLNTMREQLVDEVSFVFDNKQAVRCGVNPMDVISAMGDKISQVHISDSLEGESCVLPGNGTAKLDEIINKLREIGYNDSLVIEVYSKCIKDENDIVKSANFLKNIIK